MTIPLDELFDAFGLPAVVTAPQAERAVEATIVWLPPDTAFAPGSGDEIRTRGELTRTQTIRTAALKRAEVTNIPIVPQQTVIEAAELPDGETVTWLVDAVARVEADLIRVVVVPKEDCCG